MIDYSPSIEKSLKKCPIDIPRQLELVNCPPNGETKNLVCIRKELNRILLENCKHELEDEKKLQCAIDKAEEEKLPLEPKCIKINLVELLTEQKYDLLVTGGSSKRNLQRRIQKLLDQEADNQLGLYTQLAKKIMAEKKDNPNTVLLQYFQNNYANWLNNATCLEVAFNGALKEVTDKEEYEDIPVHCNFLEEELMKDNYHGLGHNSLVQALWRTMKTRLELKYTNNFLLAPENIQLNIDKDVWEDEYDCRNPYTNERLFTKEKEVYGAHADGTDIWRWEYSIRYDDMFGEHFLALDASYGDDLGLLSHEDRPYELEKLAQLDMKDILRQLDGRKYNFTVINCGSDKNRDTGVYYYTNDYGEAVIKAIVNIFLDKLLEIIPQEKEEWLKRKAIFNSNEYDSPAGLEFYLRQLNDYVEENY